MMNPGGPVWAAFDGNYGLPNNEVHVWRANLDTPASQIAKLQNVLCSEERIRADRFRFEADRRRSIIGRGYLRLLLGQILNVPADGLQFEHDKFGKPQLGKSQGLQFNVSHSGGLILLAIARDGAIGVDVERIRTDLDFDAIAARFFSTNECQVVASLAGPNKYHAFFRCWTRKEAYLKARGFGLSLPLDQFDVSCLPGEEPRLLASRHDPAEVGRWRLWSLNVSADYVAALAALGSNWKIRCWDLPPSAVGQQLTH